MNKNTFYGLSAVVLMAAVVLNFSKQSDKDDKGEQPINFYGTLTKTDGHMYQVDNISLAGLYEDIPLYAVPSSPDRDPQLDTTRVSLHDISSISQLDGKTEVYTYKNKDYIKIMVAWSQRKRDNTPFLIERNRVIFCNERIAAHPKKEVFFEVLAMLVVEGFSLKDQKKVKRSEALSQAEQITTDLMQETTTQESVVDVKEKLGQLQENLKQLA